MVTTVCPGPRSRARRAAGADRAGEAVDATARLLPAVRRGAAIVAFGVRHVVPLVGPERAHLLCQPFTHVDIVVGILVRHRRHLAQLRATKPQHVLLLLALRVRDDDERTVTTRVTDEREPDAGVAGSAFDDETAGLQHAALLRIQYEKQSSAILDRAARIQEFG